MTKTPIDVRRSDGHTLVITINAPERRNALTPEMLCRLADAWVMFANDPALRVAVITGSGTQAFCGGGDLARTLPLMTGDRAPEDEWDHRLLSDSKVLAASGLREFEIDKPVIAAVNGACMAAGFEMLLGSDIRLATPWAVFGLPEVKLGLIPFAGSLARLARQIPYASAMQLMLTGQAIDATEALRLGLINQIVDEDQLLTAALTMAQQIARNGPLAVSAVKRTVIRSSGVDLPVAYLLEDQAKAEVLGSQDAREGPRAFMARREPRFSGR